MSPLRAPAKHEFGVTGKGPRLLEEKIRVPFRRAPRKKRRHSCLQLKPVFNRSTLCRKVGRDCCSTTVEGPVGGGPHFQNGYCLVGIRGSLGWVNGRAILSHLPERR